MQKYFNIILLNIVLKLYRNRRDMWYFGCIYNKRNGLRIIFIVLLIEYFYMQMSLRVSGTLQTPSEQRQISVKPPQLFMFQKIGCFLCDANVMKMHERQTGDRSCVRFCQQRRQYGVMLTLSCEANYKYVMSLRSQQIFSPSLCLCSLRSMGRRPWRARERRCWTQKERHMMKLSRWSANLTHKHIHVSAHGRVISVQIAFCEFGEKMWA